MDSNLVYSIQCVLLTWRSYYMCKCHWKAIPAQHRAQQNLSLLKKDLKNKIENKVISLLRVQMEIKNIWRSFSFHNPWENIHICFIIYQDLKLE